VVEPLDDIVLRQKVDPNDMLGCIERFKDQCLDAVERARKISLPSYPVFQNILICGMGGSAIGGDLIRAYSAHHCTIPVGVNRNYTLPAYVNQNTLVIVSSYSGNTEETLAAYNEARSLGAYIIGVTTGGILAQRCKEDNNPCYTFPSGYQPRAALGYSFLSLLVLFESLGLIPTQKDALDDLHQVLNTCKQNNQFSCPLDKNQSKQLAQKLHNKIPVIYSGQDAFAPVASRWSGQFNENAKVLAHASTLPEMNHNEILGWANPAENLKNFHIIYLLDSGYLPQTRKRFEITRDLLSQYPHSIIESCGNTLLGRMFSLIHLADYVSLYLAYLYEENPTPIAAIDLFKEKLQSSSS